MSSREKTKVQFNSSLKLKGSFKGDRANLVVADGKRRWKRQEFVAEEDQIQVAKTPSRSWCATGTGT